MLVRPGQEPTLDSRFDAHLVWMAEAPLLPGRQYLIKQAARTVTGAVARIHHRIDINTLALRAAGQLGLNEIGLCEMALSAPIAFDPYSRVKGSGSFILIDRLTHGTVAAGMILRPLERRSVWRPVTQEERALRFGQQAVTLWLTGENRRQAARNLERRLFDRGYACVALDEDSLGGQAELVARQLNHAGLVCICSASEDLPPRADPVHRILDAQALDIEALLALMRASSESAGIEPGYEI
jgi:bifunctional enzyme CysN/CysC